jgi:hypothetical protein
MDYSSSEEEEETKIEAQFLLINLGLYEQFENFVSSGEIQLNTIFGVHNETFLHR